MRYAVIIEPGENNYCAYVPDLPGCVATGATFDEVKAEIAEAITLHLDGMHEDGLPIPRPTSRAEYVKVSAPGQRRAGITRDSCAPRIAIYLSHGEKSRNAEAAAWPALSPGGDRAKLGKSPDSGRTLATR